MASRGGNLKVLVLFFILLSIAVRGQAKVSLNSECYMLDQGPSSKVQGGHVTELFELASVSKVVTSYWALHELGPQFRFSTRIFITPVSGNVFDVHIAGSQDPFWGRHLTHFLISELNKKGVQEIRRLSFDENFSMRWLVISDNIDPENLTPQEIADTLARHIRDLANEYPRTRSEAAAVGIDLPRSVRLKAQSVEFVAKAAFRAPAGTAKMSLKSSPLYRYLKEMNVVSNNHVADRLFEILGGISGFQTFVQDKMGLDIRDVHFINGSGDSIVRTDGNGNQVKDYNKATCEVVIQVLRQMQRELKSPYGMDLKDVMAVSGSDGGTLSPRFDSIPNSMVAKTGTVDPAITLAGLLSTGDGDVYFGLLMSTESPADWNNARDQVRDKVMDLIQQFGGRRSFNYVSRDFLPFDGSSGFTISQSPVLSTLP